jgi:hypothetical protein
MDRYGGEIAPKVGGILHILIGENFLPPLTNGCFLTPCDLRMFRFTITSPCTLQWVKPTYWRHSQNACRVESMNIVSFYATCFWEYGNHKDLSYISNASSKSWGTLHLLERPLTHRLALTITFPSCFMMGSAHGWGGCSQNMWPESAPCLVLCPLFWKCLHLAVLE